jgi:hypothetical protein
MKASLLWLVAMVAGLSGAQADELDSPLYVNGVVSSATIDHGRLELCPYADTHVWLNGQPVNTGSPLVDPEPWPTIVMKPGDVLTYATGCYFPDRQPIPLRTFEQYRLDRLTTEGADFTLSTFSAAATPEAHGLIRVHLGKLKSVVRFRGKEFALLYEPPYPGILVGSGRQRTK